MSDEFNKSTDNLNNSSENENPKSDWQTVSQQTPADTLEEVAVAQNETPEVINAQSLDSSNENVETASAQPGYGSYVSRYPSETTPQQPGVIYTHPAATTAQPQKKAKVKKEKKKINGWIPVSIVSISCTVVCAILLTISLFANPNTGKNNTGNGSNVIINQQQTPTTQNSGTLTTDGTKKLSPEEVVQKLLPSVVQIDITTQAGSGGGSGVIMTEDGYVLTNAHVVESAQKISVTTNDGEKYDAKLIAYDSESDVGVVKIEGTFVAATFGDSSKVVPGEEVLAIGTPYSSALFQTVTKGIISASRDALTFQSLGLTLDVIQHDAAINSGNSGGALVNMYGQVIGINSVKMSGIYENLSFALQINKVLSVASDLISKGAVEKPMIGITGRTEPNIGGVLVVELAESGAAKDAGLQVNDVITKFNDNRIKTIEELTSAIRALKIGDQVSVTVIRDGEVLSFTMSLRSSV
ncbi:MAG: hypothetical protein DBX47_02820 [Clostridiales bacterium]|nr:MAG: hypothetical protein DBX47_02820 [Clostridiales bacterium]